MTTLLPISAVVPTMNRGIALERMLRSLAKQTVQPIEVIMIDASATNETEQLSRNQIPGLQSKVIHYKAKDVGAATQRNQGLPYASQGTILFCDDDNIFEPDCLRRLWEALQNDPQIGGVNAMITNQRYLPPGLLSRTVFRLLHGSYESSYAGKCIGPAFNMLPEDSPTLPEVVPVEWLNLGCTLYRREALPVPMFPSHFIGYSMMEDLTLSLTVGRKWKLANARTARVFHDSQPSELKSDRGAFAKMEVVNRHYVMTKVMGRQSFTDYLRLILLEVFGIVTPLASGKNWASLPAVLSGKLKGIGEIIAARPTS
jgi:glycosyltransferase involved in cell wall biosynthesis